MFVNPVLEIHILPGQPISPIPNLIWVTAECVRPALQCYLQLRGSLRRLFVERLEYVELAPLWTG